MNLQVKTSNGQEGKNSVEVVEVYDGDQLLATIKKVGSDRAEVEVYEALQPNLMGAIVYVNDGVDAPVMVADPAVAGGDQSVRVVHAINDMADATTKAVSKRRVKIGK